MSAKGNTKVKGLLKGLRYISNIFEGEKEQEMQIGFPTDVKHVAHIGWDGPAAINNTPTWMNEFHSAPLTTSFGQDGRDVVCSPKSASQEIPLGGGLPSDSPPSTKPPRRSRRHASSSESPESGSATPESESSSAAARASGSSRHSRRQSGSAEPSAEGSSRRGARRSSKSAGSEPGSESPARDLPSIPKQSRRRKTKTGSDSGGSTRPSSARSKDPTPADADPETRPVPVLEAVAEGGI